MPSPKHFLRYGTHADQRYFASEFHDAFDAMLFSANLVAFSPAGISGVLAHTASGKEFIVDPQAYIFQLDPTYLLSQKSNGTWSPKSSVVKLAKAYGGPLEDAAGMRSLRAEDLSEETVKRAFCRSVLDFQRSYLLDSAKEQDFFEMLKFAAKASGGDPEAIFLPHALVAPSFFLSASDHAEWLQINSSLLQFAVEYAGDTELWGSIICDRDLIANSSTRAELVKVYRASGVRRCALWVDELDEHEESIDMLGNLRALARTFSDEGIGLCNLYGGYFSTVLVKLGELAGVCHGPEWGEGRSISPVGGGVPISKFYYPRLHRRLPFAQALYLARASGGLACVEAYREHVCSCTECHRNVHQPVRDFRIYGEANETRFVRKGQVVSMAYPTPETKEHCTRHYLWNKQTEFEVYGQTQPEIVKDLEMSFQWASRFTGDRTVAHLYRWRKALTE